MSLPKITIVTPSFNQAAYLEETLLSVLNQGYPNLEYIVVDGGSTDGSVEIIKRYEAKLAHWVSERDGGQSDAINKGFARSSGEIMGWINSDDLLARDALARLADAYRPGLCWYYGHHRGIHLDRPEAEGPFDSPPVWTYDDFVFRGAVIAQVATFWNREIWEHTGGAVLDHRLIMDFDLWMRFARIVPSTPVDAWLGTYREHAAAKTGSDVGKRAYVKAKQARRLAEVRSRFSSQLACRHFGAAVATLGKVAAPLGRLLLSRVSFLGKLSRIPRSSALG